MFLQTHIHIEQTGDCHMVGGLLGPMLILFNFLRNIKMCFVGLIFRKGKGDLVAH